MIGLINAIGIKNLPCQTEIQQDVDSVSFSARKMDGSARYRGWIYLITTSDLNCAKDLKMAVDPVSLDDGGSVGRHLMSAKQQISKEAGMNLHLKLMSEN